MPSSIPTINLEHILQPVLATAKNTLGSMLPGCPKLLLGPPLSVPNRFSHPVQLQTTVLEAPERYLPPNLSFRDKYQGLRRVIKRRPSAKAAIQTLRWCHRNGCQLRVVDPQPGWTHSTTV